MEGSSVQLNCTVNLNDGSNDNFTLTWSRNGGSNLFNSTNISITLVQVTPTLHYSLLTIERASLDDHNALFTCAVSFEGLYYINSVQEIDSFELRVASKCMYTIMLSAINVLFIIILICTPTYAVYALLCALSYPNTCKYAMNLYYNLFNTCNNTVNIILIYPNIL